MEALFCYYLQLSISIVSDLLHPSYTLCFVLQPNHCEYCAVDDCLSLHLYRHLLQHRRLEPNWVWEPLNDFYSRVLSFVDVLSHDRSLACSSLILHVLKEEQLWFRSYCLDPLRKANLLTMSTWFINHRSWALYFVTQIPSPSLVSFWGIFLQIYLDSTLKCSQSSSEPDMHLREETWRKLFWHSLLLLARQAPWWYQVDRPCHPTSQEFSRVICYRCVFLRMLGSRYLSNRSSPQKKLTTIHWFLWTHRMV